LQTRLKIPQYLGINADGKKIVLAEDCITQGFAWLARRRRGKSYGAGVELEIFAQRRYPFVVLDPAAAHVGLRYRMAPDGRNPDGVSGLNILVLGGDHADIPFDPQGGKIFAQVVVEHDISAVVDLKRVGWGDRKKFVSDFADELFLINKTPRHVVLEEAHNFIPQTLRFEEQKRVFIAVEALIKEGGGQGIGFTLIDQRPAAIAKDCLNMIDNLVVLGMSGTTDIKAIRLWCENNAPELSAQITTDLPRLAPGEAWLVAPEWLPNQAERITIRPRVTWHAGRTARSGDIQPRPVKDIGVIARQFKTLLEERKKDWAAEQQSRKELETNLRNRDREIEKLKKELERKGKAQVSVPPAFKAEDIRRRVDEAVNQVIAPILAQIKQRDAALQPVFKGLLRSSEELERFTAGFNNAIKTAGEKLGGFAQVSLTNIRKEVLAKARPSVEKAKNPAPGTPAAPVIPINRDRISNDGDTTLRSGALRILTATAQFYPDWVSKPKASSLAAVKLGGTFTTYQASLNTAGYINIRKNGRDLELQATQAGLDYLATRGDLPEAPSTTEDVLKIWAPRLRAGAKRMLNVLISRGGEAVSRQEIADESEVQLGGTFTTYLSSLTAAGLAIAKDDGIAANTEALFL